MNTEMKIIREVSIQAENCYDDAVKLGKHAADVLKANRRSQMTSLENIAESSLKTSDVFDYIKKQTARFPYWRQAGADSPKGFGERLQNHLEHGMARNLTDIYTRLEIGNTTDEEKQERRRIHLLLMRQFIRHMVVNYEFFASLDNGRR